VSARIAAELIQEVKDDSADPAAAVVLRPREEQRIQRDVHG